ncbi:CD209 antigen-like protein C isoform X3 [Emydura macquarii macquarii]|uniref:CD209 antigen-like protein C isoform X3 n=1 Tax=Emydura macquarii macquarii TaxID=1129001 RepID=UPI00352BC897
MSPVSQDLAEAQMDQDKIRRDSKRNLSDLQDSLELKMSKEFSAFNNQLVNVSQVVAEAQLDQDKIRRDSKRNLSDLQDSLELKMSIEFNKFNSRLLNEIKNLTHSMWKELAGVRRDHDRLQEVLSRVQEELRNITELYTKCPPGWHHFKKNCYFFSISTKSWSEAKEFCTNQGSHLVIVNSIQEHDFLSNGVIETREYWLGLSDSAKEGEWRWLDGSLLSVKFWAKGEPNDVGDQGEDCGTLRFDGMWNDIPCSMNAYWICEQQG